MEFGLWSRQGGREIKKPARELQTRVTMTFPHKGWFVNPWFRPYAHAVILDNDFQQLFTIAGQVDVNIATPSRDCRESV